MGSVKRSYSLWLIKTFFLAICLTSVPQTDSSALGQNPAVQTVAAESSEHPLDPALRISQSSLDHIRTNIRDYTANFIKRTRVDGELSEMQCARVKIRHRQMNNGRLAVPMGVYLDFYQPDSVKGREVLWVEGRNDGKLIAHEAGFKNLTNVKLDPTGYLAMRGQRYPITDIGMENLTVKLIDTALRDRQYGECEVRFFNNAKVGDQICNMVEVTHPNHREHFDFHRARVYFSQELNMPIRYASWSWPSSPGGEPILEEEYTYINIKTNVGLTDKDFDTDNPDYRFW